MLRSFFLAGFEGSTGTNRHGDWFDQVEATGHARRVEADYREVASAGLLAARESVRWPLVDLGRGRYDFASLDPFIAAARRHDVDVIWDLFHYGFPAGLDLLGAEFPKRFADYCYAVGRHIAAQTDGTPWFTPVNEPSYMAFAGGDEALFAPHLTGRGFDLKVALCRAAIGGIDALRAAAPGARMVNADPLCHVAARPGRPEDLAAVRRFNTEIVFQSWDMLAGRLLPELGGSRDHLDVVGINYYWTNQWEWQAAPGADGRVPPLGDHDLRRVRLGDLVRSVWHRYGGAVMISETAHVGDRRAAWIRELARECAGVIADGVPLIGACLYPIHGMPEWHDPAIWTAMGLWDPVFPDRPHDGRTVHRPMLKALREAEAGVAAAAARAELSAAPGAAVAIDAPRRATGAARR